MIVTVFGQGYPSAPALLEMAEELGKRLCQQGHSIKTGGYGGTMEAVSKGAEVALVAASAIGDTTGITITGVTCSGVFTDPAKKPNPHVTHVVDNDTLLKRIDVLLDADVAIALPGSLGTLTEIFCAWCHGYIARPKPRRLIVWDTWRPLLEEAMKVTGVSETVKALVHFCTDVDHCLELVNSLPSAG